MPIRADILSQLADVLAELYPDHGSIRAMTFTAGLAAGKIAFYPRAIDTWVFVLNEAEAQNRTQTLLTLIMSQYPAHELLRSANQTYIDWVTAGRPGAATQPQQTQPMLSDNVIVSIQNDDKRSMFSRQVFSQTPNVFISYVRENAALVDKLAHELRLQGVNVWLDRDKIMPGMLWKDAIRQAIQKGDYFIACFSVEYVARPLTYMNTEIGLAIEMLQQMPIDRIWFIPVLLSECEVPDRTIGGGQTLRDLHWEPLHKDWDLGIHRILQTLGGGRPANLAISAPIHPISTPIPVDEFPTGSGPSRQRLGYNNEKTQDQLYLSKLSANKPWHKGVQGSQVLPIIDLNDDIIRVEAGPGTGKTYGLVRRVQRIVHPEGLNVPGNRVLVVAFNRIIAKQLQKDIDKRLLDSPHNGTPVIQTVHALCLRVMGTYLRILLPHEREAMIYDVLCQFPNLRQKHENYRKAEQALRDHEAKHQEDIQLWQAAQQWLTRHHALLIGDLPSLLLDKLQGGDFGGLVYEHVIVDEYQDLTPGEQELFLRLRAKGGKFLALGDPRQSIYRFRGNDWEGLSKIGKLLGPSDNIVKDIAMTECQRCPKEIVRAANQLMSLSGAQEMTPGSQVAANLHVVVWKSPEAEAKGMAKAIVDNIHIHPESIDHLGHLAMVTRRQFGYMLREEIHKLDPSIKVDLSFSESLLETWAVREAFLYFCLIVDPDAPTWRAWLGYKNSTDGKAFKASKRNAHAYLGFLTKCKDVIDEAAVYELASGPNRPPGDGGNRLWERAKRYVSLRGQLEWDGNNGLSLLEEIFDAKRWGVHQSTDPQTAQVDMELLLKKASAIFQEWQSENPTSTTREQLKEVARTLRYQIATREPFVPDESSDLKVATLWGAKGVTADHVYVIGLCEEAIPGTRREEYPGTALEFREEQRRLFYVSITRPRKTLVLSRANSIALGQAKRLDLQISDGNGPRVELQMCPFLRDINKYLPEFQYGENWQGCS